MGKKTTKNETTPMLQETLSEVDWDLLEQMDMEEEGQVLPMQDPPQTKASSQPSSIGQAPYQEEHPGPIPQPPKGFKP